MRKLSFILVALIVVLLSSCTSFVDFYSDGEVWASVDESVLKDPGVPSSPEANLQFVGWVPEGSTNPVENWKNPPRDVETFNAKFTRTIKYYSDEAYGELFATQLVTDFGKPGFSGPGAPDAPEGKIFVGWVPADEKFEQEAGWVPSEGNAVYEDWSTVPADSVDFMVAKYVDEVYFYLDGVLWTVLRSDEFGNPGSPEPREIPRGYEFGGWVAETDYAPTTDWETLPDNVRRYDAMLTRVTVASGMEGANEQLRLNLAKNTQVLGPITVEETYEILDGQVRIGGIGYKDILAAAIEAYPDADQVVDIITDYETHTADSEYGTITFQTASYTGIAIAIE